MVLLRGGGSKDKDGDNAANVIVAEMLMEDHHTIIRSYDANPN